MPKKCYWTLDTGGEKNSGSVCPYVYIIFPKVRNSLREELWKFILCS